MKKILQRVDQSIARMAASVGLWMVWPFAYSIAVAVGVWTWFRHEELGSKIANNRVPWESRLELAQWVGASMAAMVTLYLIAIAVDRIRKRHFCVVSVASELNRWLRWTLGLPFFSALRLEGVERSDPLFTAFTCALAAFPAAVTVYQVPKWLAREEKDPGRHWSEIALGIAAPATMIALGVAYGWLFSDLSVTNHQALNTRTTDLGYYDNIFYQSLHGRPLGCTFIKGGTHISAHFDPILVLLSPLYLLRGEAELLLILQSVWLASGVLPLFLLTRRVLESWGAAVVMCVVWVVYPAMHGANMYEFHSLTLIAPLVLWLLYTFEIGAKIPYFIFLLLLLLCREDIPLLLCTIGFGMMLRRRPGDAGLGLLTIAISAAYFIFVKRLVMPSEDVLNAGKESYGYAYYFRDMIPAGKGAAELVLSLLTNPWFALKHAFADPKKVLYLLQLFLPLAFLPFVARGGRVMLAYGLLITLAASREPVYTAHFQYSCLIFPVAFGITPLALRRIRDSGRLHGWGLDGERLMHGLLGFMLIASLLVSWKFGAIWENKAFRGGFSPIARELSPRTAARWAAVREMKSMIEPGASVTVTNIIGPHASNRAEVYFYKQKRQTHYVFIHDSDLRKWVDTWHKERLRRGALELLSEHKHVKLYRVIPENDLTADEAIELWRERRKKPNTQKKVPKPRPRPKPKPRAPRPGGEAAEGGGSASKPPPR